MTAAHRDKSNSDNELHPEYHCYINSCQRLDSDEQKALVLRLQQNPTDDEAKQLLVDSTIRLIVKIARRYKGQGVPLQDLVQEGIIGLFNSIPKFDTGRATTFSTYATFWIRQRITRYLRDTTLTIRVPAYRHDQLHQIEEEKYCRAQDRGRMPSRADLEEMVEDMIRGEDKKLEPWSLTPSELLTLRTSHIPWEEPAFDDDLGNANVQGDYIPYPDDPEMLDLVEHSGLRDVIQTILDGFKNERERMVVQMFFGLPPYRHRYILDEIGKKLGVTRERARQLKQAGLRHFRHPKNRRILKAYLNEN